MESLAEYGAGLLGTELGFEYQRGWSKDKSLEQSLEEGMERDLQQGATQHGPHRADLKICYDERQARKLVSRGQQKLLASAMILAATETAQTALERPLLLLLDDPAAELSGGCNEPRKGRAQRPAGERDVPRGTRHSEPRLSRPKHLKK